MVCNDWIKFADPTAPTITSLPADLAMTTTWTKFEGDGHINLLLCAQRTVSFVIFLLPLLQTVYTSIPALVVPEVPTFPKAMYDPSKKSTHSSHETAPIRSLMI